MQLGRKQILILIVGFLLTLGPGALANLSQEPHRSKKILFFASDDARLPGGLIAEDAVRTAITKAYSHEVEFFNEGQDHARIPNEKYEAEYIAFLRRKYEGIKIDLIFIRAASGIKFLLEHEAEIFTGVPKVFVANDQREIADVNLGGNATGVFGKIDFGRTVALILEQQPGLKRIVVVTGSSSRDEFYRGQAKKDLSPYTGRVQIDYLSGLAIPELQKQMAALSSGDVCLFISYGSDPTGNGYSLPEALSRVVPSVPVPTYAVAETAMGTGVVGGNLISFHLIGERAAEMGLRILAGEKPSSITPATVESVTMFDARQLRRWNLDENSLPPGSVLQFREPTAWEEYKWNIIAAAAFIILETLLIGWLLFIRARKQRAEEESERLADMVKAEHQKLQEVVSNVPGIVWESRVISDHGDRRLEFVSDYVEQMLGYTRGEIEGTANFWRTIVLEEDQPALDETLHEIFTGSGQGIKQFRCRAKDGTIVWVAANFVATRDEDGNVKGMRGVIVDITDRKIAEDELELRELDLSEAQRLAQIGSWEWDPANDAVRWTEQLYRIAGLDPSSPAPNFEEHKKLYTSESYERLAGFVSKALDTGAAYELELQMIRSDGELIWVSARGEVIHDENGNVVKLRGTVQDINARKEAEGALSESEERYRNVVETQTELICRYLPDCTLTFVNDAYCRYFGKTREELVGTKFVDLIPVHARHAMLEHIDSMIKVPRTEMYEHEVIKPDGTTGWQQWIDHLVQVPGKPLELQGIGRDITDKRRIEDALRVSESRFRNMADSAPLMIWMSDTEGLCTYVNQGWCRFSGRSADSELGDGWTAGIHEDDRARCQQTHERALERREAFRIEFRLRAADNEFRWVFSSGTPRFSAAGEFLGFIGSCVDISDQKTNEEALKTALDEVRDLQKQLHEENIYLKEVIELEHKFDEIIGNSDALKYVLYKIEQVAETEATVLITGETGTGKELVARAIHSTSGRKSKPLVSVNCAALSSTLIESELFGHERGAFTGASARKIGRFELAAGSTIFLDEVGELPLELQAKLLRVIQEGEFERLGSSKTIKTDARIIAATNRNLDAEVKRGTFREDLLFRLNVFPITVPPLRERKEDIPELVEYFVSRFSKKIGKRIRGVSPVTIRKLSEHAWPGNVRELANVIERSVINSQGEILTVFQEFGKGGAESDSRSSVDTLEAIERKYIKQVLVNTGWKIEGQNGAAHILGLHPSTLRTRMAKLGISKNQSEGHESRIVT